MPSHGNSVSSKISMVHALLIGRSERRGRGRARAIISSRFLLQINRNGIGCRSFRVLLEPQMWEGGQKQFLRDCLAAFLIVGWEKKNIKKRSRQLSKSNQFHNVQIYMVNGPDVTALLGWSSWHVCPIHALFEKKKSLKKNKERKMICNATQWSEVLKFRNIGREKRH